MLQKRLNGVAEKTAVGTVYALQGSERQFIIVSFVRSTVEGAARVLGAGMTAQNDTVVSVASKNEALRQTCETSLGIVSNEKSLNVAITRAKAGLICIGNATVLSEGSRDFFDLASHLKGRECLLSKAQFARLQPSG
eukprot:TRINITY_DN2816_c0_g1_i1.p2 TRINITY_DN2816_c0_g1~~TRINITY_DN2816_c0_g1_i1.p2  ORF type:complete len:137 (+),score=29.11 TRINITY_DN2816_c0_g1_i1:165-575(+)